MKTKFYLILTGLLMAACITNYGQEIVGEFTLQNGKLFSNTDIMECSDGTLLTGIFYYSSDYEEYGFLVCKTTPEGQLIDSVVFDNGQNLFSINGATDSYVIPITDWNEVDNTGVFRMYFIDADLNLTETIEVPLFSGIDINNLSFDELFLTPENDFIISYWTDFEINNYWTDYAVFHIMRISLDGIIVSESETDGILPPNWSNMHPADSALTYYERGFGIFEETPRVYYKLGGYIGTSSSHPWPLFTYFFDENLNLTDTIVYDYLEEDTYFDWAGNEHLVPFEKDTVQETYLMAGQIHYPDGKYASSLVKYDMNHNPLIIAKVDPPTMHHGNPIETVVVDESTIFHAYQCHPSNYSYAIGLARLDNDLNVLWNTTLSEGQFNYAYGQCLKVLQNGDVAIAFSTSYGNSGDHLHLYIIHDDYDGTSENTDKALLFTLHPNPVKDMLKIECEEETEVERASLYDLTGRLVATYGSATCRIDLSCLPAGVYLLRVTTTDESTYHERIIKE